MIDLHRWSASTYQLIKLQYSLSFRERINMDLGMTHYLLGKPSEELLALSDEELLAKIKSLKAPWWNSIYEKKVSKNLKLLAMLYLITNIRTNGFYTFKLLYMVLKSDESRQK